MEMRGGVGEGRSDKHVTPPESGDKNEMFWCKSGWFLSPCRVTLDLPGPPDLL